VYLTLAASLALAQEGGKAPMPPPRVEPPQASPTSGPQMAGEQGGRVHPGDPAPDFELDGSLGKPVKLTSMRGDWLILVFADRSSGINEMNEIEYEARKLGARIVGICHEKMQSIMQRAVREPVQFVVLSDPTGQVTATYGLWDSQQRRSIPGYVIVDRRGKVKLAVMGQSFPPADVLKLTRYAITGA
jgi:peroxiredoxin